MAKPKSPAKDQKTKEDQPAPGTKIAIITTIITAVVGLLGTVVTVYIQDVYRPGLWAGQTQTAEVANPQSACPPVVKEPSTTEVAILREYVNVDEAGVYSEKDRSMKPFQTLYRGDAVEVLDTTDRTWACITYERGDVRVYGYVLRDELILSFALTQTAVANDASATATVSP